MVYSDNVKKELDSILEAFADYIDGQNYFDIVWSNKIGYVWIVVDHPGDVGAEPLDTPKVVLEHFFNSIINDVIAPRESTSLCGPHTLTENEEAEVRRRLTTILKPIENGADEYLHYLDEYIQNCKSNCFELHK